MVAKKHPMTSKLTTYHTHMVVGWVAWMSKVIDGEVIWKEGVPDHNLSGNSQKVRLLFFL
jgi:hypothetical protein